ncbi:hypothetical protein SAMN04489727_3195 [Amycolatopsis tolypomycina]|uniref:Uncharacterized protein n=1 Tax=Amycolatopsis tolypomycina TaxID=208445 RepID=A0A1H4R826_9PSEU|nr:hypothetical protein [Amycolatopsis tolypomycina]SEC27904.1 hypothetical protein SAMN04489727_3195 [Amycolatopsis tolypomycina]
MAADVWIGVGGACLAVAAAVLRAKSRRRPVVVAASLAVAAGWALVAQFLLKALFPGAVLAVVILGGIVLGILLAAFLGGRGNLARKK